MSKNSAVTTSEVSGGNGTAGVPAAESKCPPHESEIAALAYRLWLDRGCPDGSPEQDWFLAEEELRQQAR